MRRGCRVQRVATRRPVQHRAGGTEVLPTDANHRRRRLGRPWHRDEFIGPDAVRFQRAACRLNGTHDGVPIDIRHHWFARRGVRRGIHTSGRPAARRVACHRLRPWNRWGNPRLRANRGFPPARRHHFGGDTAQARLRGGIHRLRGSGRARRGKPGRGDSTCLPGAKVGRVQPHRCGKSRTHGGAAAVVAMGGIGIVAGRRNRLGGRRIFCGLRAGHRSARRRGAGSHARHVWTGAAGRILNVDRRPDVSVPECDRGSRRGRQVHRSERLPARRSTRRRKDVACLPAAGFPGQGGLGE